MLKRILITIAFLLTCASFVQAQEGIFSAPDCATRIGSPVIGKTWCYDQTQNALLGYAAAGWFKATPLPASSGWSIDAVLGITSNGIVVRTSSSGATTRSVVGGSSKVSVANGDGVSGNISVDVVPGFILLQNLGGAVIDSQVPDLKLLGTGLTASRCVQTDAAGKLSSTSGACGSGSGSGGDTGIEGLTPGTYPRRASASAILEDGNISEPAPGEFCFGDCSTDYIREDMSALVGAGEIVRGRRAVDGDEGVTDGVLPDGNLASFDSEGRVVDSGVAGFPVVFGFMLGAEDGSALVDTNDQPTIYRNMFGQALTIQSIWCQTDAGTSTINLQKNDGSAADISASDMVCDATGVTSTSFTSGENVLAAGDTVDLDVVDANTSGTPKRISIFVKGKL